MLKLCFRDLFDPNWLHTERALPLPLSGPCHVVGLQEAIRHAKAAVRPGLLNYRQLVAILRDLPDAAVPKVATFLVRVPRAR